MGGRKYEKALRKKIGKSSHQANDPNREIGGKMEWKNKKIIQNNEKKKKSYI